MSDLGVVLANMGRAAEAEPVLRSASAIEPADPHVQLQIGRLLAVLTGDRLQEAAVILSSTLRYAAKAASSGDEDSQKEEAAAVRDKATQELRSILARPVFAQAMSVGAYTAFDPREKEKPALPQGQAEHLQVAAVMLRALSEEGLSTEARTQALHDLGHLLALNSRKEEALDAYRSTVSLSPGDSNLRISVEFNSGVMLGLLDRASEAIVLYKNVAAMQPGNHRVREYLGDMLLRLQAQDEAEHWYTGAAHIHLQNNASFRFLVNFQGSNEAFWQRHSEEAQALDNEVRKVEVERKGQASQAQLLPGILRSLRDTEVKSSWQVARLMECAKSFGASESTKFTCGYGMTWFDTAWKPIMDLPIVSAAIDAARASTGGPGVVVLGSALGEHCLFTNLLLGVPCAGYDLLCETNVGVASSLVPQGAKVSFYCEDALKAEIRGARVVWLLDVVWPLDLQKALEKRLATLLPHGAVVILYRPPAWTDGAALVPHPNILSIEVSWKQNLLVTILEKHSHSTVQSDEL
eukprot:gnl/MRDRNA2_/MRDRNA2_213536_c0_seq1.p1 gnl/MRDRNA2_/MRDRNA2_213536_c0~~gnl/MRDRNA2_/MRDRNA2_213536_c0_seq1.p1  ORF type:complete len:591 (+),score=118.31 gnl/MRDRNA2_/MRDRNA2_213536_c0_seq1:210-1775(+)